jgi:FAD:protein FMN transferase
MSFHCETFDAIGVKNVVAATTSAAAAEAGRIARREVALLDEACSRFRDDSELAALNAAAGRGPVTVSALLCDAVEAAVRSAAQTDGLVDPTIGRSLRAIGYDRDFTVLVRSGATPSFELIPASGFRSVRLDSARRTVALPRGVELDLGATAKAFAADRIAAIAATALDDPVLISLGGDIAIAGTPDGGWPVRATDDSRAADGGEIVALNAGGLATSSTTVRRWRAGAVERHHIIDPRTGAPAAEYWRTATVAAATCLDANTAATASIVLGRDAADWLTEGGLAARLVHLDGRVHHTRGWPSPTELAAA